MIKTAILGYGRSGSTLHATPIERLPELQCVAACDTDPAALKKAFDRFGCAVYEDHAKMLAGSQIDLCVIVTPNNLHAEQACACLAAGVDVLMTKPWAVDTAQLETMQEAAEKHNKRLFYWAPARWGCDLIRLRELVAGGAVGNVFMVRRAEFTFGVRRDWQTLRAFNGGYLLNWGPHLVDQAMCLLGGEPQIVWGDMRQAINPGDCEDIFCAMIKMQSGALAQVEFTVGGPGYPNWVVQGDRGTLYVYGTKIILQQTVPPQGEEIDILAYRQENVIETTDDALVGKNQVTMGNRYGDSMVIYPPLINTVLGRDGEQYDFTYADARRTMLVLDAVRRAAESGEVVKL
ncbi:MAG: Gfo/Idh/MocA family oxidoreductase [Clostridia bacterium]|nr:Gfo/Idh/MocA family oxidoreductase [Clostridia bacterium]